MTRGAYLVQRLHIGLPLDHRPTFRMLALLWHLYYEPLAADEAPDPTPDHAPIDVLRKSRIHHDLPSPLNGAVGEARLEVSSCLMFPLVIAQPLLGITHLRQGRIEQVSEFIETPNFSKWIHVAHPGRPPVPFVVIVILGRPESDADRAPRAVKLVGQMSNGFRATTTIWVYAYLGQQPSTIPPGLEDHDAVLKPLGIAVPEAGGEGDLPIVLPKVGTCFGERHINEVIRLNPVDPPDVVRLVLLLTDVSLAWTACEC
mmetsp:Transcript_26610/g.58436  ORF Transcript_26610/g.58436 Transcript_26610/m.58436 type:complete len:258 (+) Transcript_26610:852-1625(+)